MEFFYHFFNNNFQNNRSTTINFILLLCNLYIVQIYYFNYNILVILRYFI